MAATSTLDSTSNSRARAAVETADPSFATTLAHGLDVLALEFLDHTMTSITDLCGKGRSAIPFDECPVDAARDYACEDADMALRLRRVFEPQLE